MRNVDFVNTLLDTERDLVVACKYLLETGEYLLLIEKVAGILAIRKLVEDYAPDYDND